MTRLKPDICVIGGGAAGLSVAAAAAAFGVPVVLVEKGEMGGDCLNHGCVPSKALIAAARHVHAMRNGARFGIADAEPQVDYRQVQRRIRDVIVAIAPNDSAERFTALGVRVIREEARFADPRTVVAGGFEIRARRFVVATGSSPVIPPIPGLDEVAFHTNETIFGLTRLPSSLLVVGGGAVGLELAQAFRRLGSEVCVVEAGRALAREDPELAALALDRLRAEGIDIREGTQVLRVERRGRSGVRLHVEDAAGVASSVDGAQLLVAAGRRPVVDGLDLDRAGIAVGPNGILVDDRLRTTNGRVHAIGDVAGQGELTSLAGYHAGLVVRSILFRLRARAEPLIVPRVTFVDPEIAHVGLREDEARAQHKGVTTLRWPYAENDRAQTAGSTEGLVKVVAGRRGRILGVSIVGAEAGELIGVWALAIARRLTLRDMAAYVSAYPTLGEIGKRAAISYFAGAARKPGVRRLVRFLRLFG